MESIAALCENLKAARETKKILQAQLKEIEDTISQLKNDVASELTAQGLEECVTGGYSYSVSKSYRVSVAESCGSKDLVNLFRSNHQGDLITEYVHPSRLKSFVTKELKTNEELPSWLSGSVLVEETSQLSIRKSKKTGEEDAAEEELTEEETEYHTFVPSCDNCQLRKSERCTQIRNELCNDYRAVPFISQEEKENWPSYGDATAYSLGEMRG